MALGAPTLWTNIRILGYHAEGTRESARVYLERSKACPTFLTWFTEPGPFGIDVTEVIEGLIIPAAERWRRITLIAGEEVAPEALLTAMEPLDFPNLQDLEVSCVPAQWQYSPKHTLCRSAPLLRRCRFRDTLSLPSLPSNLVVLDCVFIAFGAAAFDLDHFLQFLPHVAHSLEHLRFGPPPASEVHSTPSTSRIPLENLKSLLISNSYVVMDHILAPNLTTFVVSHSVEADAGEAGRMFDGFPAPKLRSIQFRGIPLLPFLATRDLPPMFPQLESVLLSDCADESAFVHLLEPPKPTKPSASKNTSNYPPNDPKVENPFPHLRELTISDMTIWTSLQSAIEKRLKNGNESLRKIRLPKGRATETFMPHLRRWLPRLGVELVLYEHGELPRSTLEFQDEFCDEENRLFSEIIMEGDSDDVHYWEEQEDMFFHDHYDDSDSDDASVDNDHSYTKRWPSRW